MRHAQLDRVLDEFYAVRTPQDDPVLEAVETAIFLEDALGIVLTDAEIDAAHLGNRAAVLATLRSREA